MLNFSIYFFHSLEFNSPEYQSMSFYDASVESSRSGAIKCPEKFTCTRLLGQSESVCCANADDAQAAESQHQPIQEIQERSQSSEFLYGTLHCLQEFFSTFFLFFSFPQS